MGRKTLVRHLDGCTNVVRSYQPSVFLDGQLSPANVRREMLVKFACSFSSGKLRTMGAVVTALAGLSGSAAAQGYALCYTQAAASGPRMIHALMAGIVILVFPAMALSVFFIALAYRRRDHFSQVDRGSEFRPFG
jgi:hypothetical protein